MNIIKSLFSQKSDRVYDAPYDVLANDHSKSATDRARDISAAFNRAWDQSAYLEFRDKHLKDLHTQFRVCEETEEYMKKLWESSAQHTKTVTELAHEGDDTLLQNVPLLKDAEAMLLKQRQMFHRGMLDTADVLKRLKNTFTMLAMAEKQMTRLREANKKSVSDGLTMLDHHGAQLQKMLTQLPENNDLKRALAKIRNDEKDRAAQAREAAAAVTHKIHFNEYLKTGLATGNAVTAPSTARFTRKPKPVSA